MHWLTYIEDAFDLRHGHLLEKSVKRGRTRTPVLGFAIGSVGLLDAILLLVDRFSNRLSPLVLERADEASLRWHSGTLR